jgi:hypothetical protein
LGYLQRLELLDRADPAHQPRLRMRARVGREHTVGVGEQQQPFGADEDRHLRGEEVVVAE